MFDVVAVGECLIDFTSSGKNDVGSLLFARNPGGAPANLLAMYAKLGGKTAFIGKVGQDSFGDFLERTMKDAHIDTTGLVRTSSVPTTLAFVQLDAAGNRSFSFYRNPGADICLQASEVQAHLLEQCRVFHFGSVSLTGEPARAATTHSVKKAKEAGAIISYDPNYRPLLWESEQVAKQQVLAALPLADVVKVSEEEMVLLTGEQELSKGARALAQHGAALVVVTRGPEGAYYHTKTAQGSMATYNCKTIDTTGAGDAFWGALLYMLRGKTAQEIGELNSQELECAIDFANATGSLTTTRYGAIPAMPSQEEICQCIAHTPKLA